MKRIFCPSEKKGFAVINGKIVECSVVSATINYQESHATSNDDKFVTVRHANGVEKNVPFTNFFGSIEKLKNDECVEWKSEVWLPYRFNNVELTIDNNELNFSYWSMVDGVAKKTFTNFTSITVSFDEEGRIDKVTSPDVPDTCYKTMEECYAFNDIVIVDEKGNETTHVGCANLCKLTKEQDDVLCEMEKLFQKAKDLGIIVVSDWNGTYAFNTNNLADQITSYEGKPDEGYERVDMRNKIFKRSGWIFEPCSDEAELYIKRK